VANGIAGTMNLCTLGAIFVRTLFLRAVQHHSPLIAGAVAGQPSSQFSFVDGLHAVALAAAILYLVAAAFDIALIRDRAR
jgi:hypothetical protein